jgi:hypothetical protein
MCLEHTEQPTFGFGQHRPPEADRRYWLGETVWVRSRYDREPEGDES